MSRGYLRITLGSCCIVELDANIGAIVILRLRYVNAPSGSVGGHLSKFYTACESYSNLY